MAHAEAEESLASASSPDNTADNTAENFDEEIAQVREQIQELTNRRRLLGKSLLSSTNIQRQLKKHTTANNAGSDSSFNLPVDDDPLATTNPSGRDQPTSSDTAHLTNMYRLSFTVTTFPFTDPSPNSHATLNGRLLGIRFDHCSRLGTFQPPYYILLRRVETKGDEWRVHRHTIPAFIPLSRLEETYLPLKSDEDLDASTAARDGDEQGENSGIGDGSAARRQDLHGFVRKVRYELASWNLRWDAIDQLKEQLNLTPPPRSAKRAPRNAGAGAGTRADRDKEHNTDDADGEGEEQDTTMTDDPTTGTSRSGLYGISSIEPTAFEARQVRITWTDGTIGRIKINNRGVIERAVVVGESGRIRGVENLLVDGVSRIENLIWKLRFLVGEGSKA